MCHPALPSGSFIERNGIVRKDGFLKIEGMWISKSIRQTCLGQQKKWVKTVVPVDNSSHYTGEVDYHMLYCDVSAANSRWLS